MADGFFRGYIRDKMDGYVREKDDAKEAPERRIARKLDADPRDKVVNQTFQDEDIIPSYLLWNWGLFFGGAGGPLCWVVGPHVGLDA